MNKALFLILIIGLFSSCFRQPELIEKNTQNEFSYIDKWDSYPLDKDEKMYVAYYNYFITQRADDSYVLRKFYGDVLTEQANYLDAGQSVRNGKTQYFDLYDGHLKSEIIYLNGEEEGEEIRYFSNGMVSKKTMNVKGYAHGNSTSYYESGALKIESNYENGEEISPRKYFYESGEVERICEVKSEYNESLDYFSSLLHGDYEYYSIEGKLICKGKYNEGLNESQDCFLSKLKNENEVFTIVEEMPSFPGGEEAMMKYIFNNLKYPAVARHHGLEGLVVISFEVDKQGKLDEFIIRRGIDPSLAEEALRVLQSMPDWTPGKSDGVPVRVAYNLPVRYRLE